MTATLRRTLVTASGALALLGASPAGAQLTIRLSVPRGTPAGSAIYVAGSFNG